MAFAFSKCASAKNRQNSNDVAPPSFGSAALGNRCGQEFWRPPLATA